MNVCCMIWPKRPARDSGNPVVRRLVVAGLAAGKFIGSWIFDLLKREKISSSRPGGWLLRKKAVSLIRFSNGKS